MVRAKAVILKLPGARRAANGVRRLARALIPRIPGVRRPLWRKFVMDRAAEDESLISALQTAAHVLDHHMLRGARVPAQSMLNMEVLIADIAARRLPLGPSIQWALQMYTIARMGLDSNYLASSVAKPERGSLATGLPDIAANHGPDLAHSELVDCIATRRSVRRWTDRPVDLAEVRRLIGLATWAPSSCNRQTWKVLLVEDRADKDFLTQYYQSAHNHFWADAPLLIVVLANLEPYGDSRTTYVQMDSGAFIQNMLLFFHAHGLGACWVGFPFWDNYGNCSVDESKRDAFYQRFALPTHYLPTSLIPVGHPAVAPRPPARKAVDEILIDLHSHGCHEVS